MTARLLSLLTIYTLGAGAQEIDIESLGQLSLDYRKVETVTTYPGQQLAATVTARKGEAYTLVAPRRVQQVQYLAEVGAWVEKGAPIAVLRGPEMHHFLAEYEAATSLLAVAKRRFSTNKSLYAQKSISESQWIEVSERYYRAQLEYEHMRHFHDLIATGAGPGDSTVITAPISGIVDYSPGYNGIMAGENIAVFIPPTAVRLKVSLPSARRDELAYLATPLCRLDIAGIGSVAAGFFVPAWTVPVTPECNLIPGQTLLATPFFNTSAYQIAKAAVFQWQQTNFILVRAGRRLTAVEVDLIGSSANDYMITAATHLQDRDVLVASVSAVQGMLLGLGGE